jgi:hypothetical protein
MEQPASPRAFPPCTYCQGFGYVQVYCTVVFRVYCDCDTGSRRIQSVRKTLEEVGLDPDSPGYQWLRRADVSDPYKEAGRKSDLPSGS